jgi:hypothetical protein
MSDAYGYIASQTAEKPVWKVALCSGEELEVLTETEHRWFNANRDAYLSQTKFSENTDIQDLDRLLVLELLSFRWSQHLAMERDYENQPVELDGLRKQLKEQATAITALKTSLGLDNKSRRAALNEGDFATWFADAKRRARIFGIHRENQLQRALVLMNELSGIVGAYDRSDEEERKKLGFENESAIVAWVREFMLPEFHKVDQYFVENEQKFWKRDL